MYTDRKVSTLLGLALAGSLLMTGGLQAEVVLDGGGSPRLSLQAGVISTTAATDLLKSGVAAFEPGAAYVFQLAGPLTRERLAALRAIGIEPGQYLPHGAYIVQGPTATPAQVSALGFVRWVGRYDNSWKLSPAIGQTLAESPERQAIAARGDVAVQVNLFEGRRASDQVAVVQAIPGAVVLATHTLGGNEVLSVTLPAGEVGRLAEIDAVQFVDETPEVALRNSSNRWIAQSNVFEVTPVYDAGIHGEGQIIGIIDGRVDVNHCSFTDSNFPVNTVDPSHRKVVGYHTTFGNHDHGTHVACTAVGDAGNNTDTRGVAYGARITFSPIPSFTEQAVIDQFVQNQGDGARIHTNSWGNDSSTSYDGLCRGIDVFSYDNEEDLVTLAVTNAGNLRNPENAKNLLAVGASQDTPNQGAHCSGGEGPTSDGRRKPEIYAPGCSTGSADGNSTTLPHCGTRTDTGSSMATPVIAASAALIRQYFMDGYYPTGSAVEDNEYTPSAALIKATLLNSATDMDGVTGYPSDLEGWGRVLLDDALYFPGDARGMIVLEDLRNAEGLAQSGVVEHTIEVTGSTETLRVTLGWTDPPATSGAFDAWINDLDLEVVAPDATVYKGNVFANGRSVSGGLKDDRNNVEQVLVETPAVGAWTVRVTAATVVDPEAPQGFALLATGMVQATAVATGACCTSTSCSEVPGAAACDVYVCDVTAELPITFTGCFADADGNGFVNAGDRGFVGANVGVSSPVLVCLYDMDGNGFVNAGDRGFVAANIGQCSALPDYQNGSGLNGGVPDTRFGAYLGDGTDCGSVVCP